VRVLTCNMHSGVGRDGLFSLARVAEVIRTSGADLVALQEVPRFFDGDAPTGHVDAVRILAEMTGLFAAYGPAFSLAAPYPDVALAGREWPQFGNALFSRFPIRWSLGHPLAYFEFADGPVQRRGVLEASVATPEGDLRVFVTHLGVDERERVEQANELARRVGTTEGPLLLVGDLNSLPDSPPVQVLRHEPACLELAGERLATARDRPIDFILLRGLRAASVVEAIRSGASDHLPVVADITWL
jgi:endonuclease/exonuclease/phosphatase family metal-dependent hydrolase